MSHNKNYSKFSKRKESINLEEIFPDKEAIEDKKVDENILVVGFVDNCENLRVRNEASSNSEILCIISNLSEVVIDIDNSTNEFYKVKTSEGVEGYCMKKFITIK